MDIVALDFLVVIAWVLVGGVIVTILDEKTATGYEGETRGGIISIFISFILRLNKFLLHSSGSFMR